MNQDENRSREEWYRTQAHGDPPEGQTPSLPEDAATNFQLDPPHRASGTSQTYAEPYRSESERPTGEYKPHTWARAMGICLLVLVLIAATTLTFTDGRGNVDIRIGDWSFNSGTPAAPAPTATPGYAEDYRDYFDGYYTASQTPTGNTIPRAPVGGNASVSFSPAPDSGELTLQQVYPLCSPSVVAITAETGESGYYWGSGIVMTADGYIITNYHVLDGTKSAKVTLYDDTEYSALLVGFDSISDIAVLKIDASGLTPATFGDSAALHVGDRVVAIGNPLGEELRGTMTDGIISAINRDISYRNHTMTLLQTNAAINEGNSGGPLINLYGQVVGITNMKMMSSSFSSTIEGIGFAIPSSTMKTVVDQLIATGAVTGRPAIGITVGPIPDGAAEYYDLPSGLYIESVSAGSDAEAKGIQPGDILTAVNGTPVTTTYDVSAIKDGMQVGETLTLTIFRSGKTFDVEVTMVESGSIN